MLAERGATERPVPPDTLLVEWFCGLHRQPQPTDLGAHARALGLSGRRELLQLLAREYLYSHALRDVSTAGSGGDD